MSGLVIEIERGVARFGGKRDRYMKSLLKFAATLPGEKLDYSSPEAATAVHTVKGVAGNLGITSLYEQAIECEKVLKDVPTEQAYDSFYEACAEAGREILATYGEAQAADAAVQPEGSASEYAELIRRLKIALGICDASAIDRVVNELKAKKWPTKTDLAQVFRLIEGYRYIEAEELLVRE